MSIFGGDNVAFAEFISGTKSLFGFLESKQRNEEFKEFYMPNFLQFVAFQATTRLLTSAKEIHTETQRMALPTYLNPGNAIAKAAERDGLGYTEDNHIPFKTLVLHNG